MTVNDTTSTPTFATQVQEHHTTKEIAAAGLLAEVALRVKESGSEVRSRFIDTLVEKEISERVALLDKVMQKRFQCLTELNKVNRPDVETFNADGTTASATYSKDRLKAIKDGKEALAKVEWAIEKAFTGDWSKVKETCK